MKHSILYSDFSVQFADSVREYFKTNEKQLQDYISRLLWWNNKINLVSRNVSRETLHLHILHSLVITHSPLFNSAQDIIDTGTGGGLPGIPLAIANPDKKFILNDIISKKMMACRAMINSLALENVHIELGSIEQVQINSAVLVSKHAFKINELYPMIRAQKWSHLLMLKGKEEVHQELEGITDPLAVHVIDLAKGFGNVFFNGKALIEISR